MEFDSVQIGVEDLAGAARDYERLLGISPSRSDSGSLRFALQREAVELEAGRTGIHSMRFDCSQRSAMAAGRVSRLARALRCRATAAGRRGVGGGCRPGHRSCRHPLAQSGPRHRLVAGASRLAPGARPRVSGARTADALLSQCRGHPGVRRNLAQAPDAQALDVFYGMAYRVGSLERCRDRLLRAQLDVSAIRNGNKPRTMVATVRGGTAGVPTLLIEDASRDNG